MIEFVKNLLTSNPSSMKELRKYLKRGREVYCVFRNTDGTIRYKDIFKVTRVDGKVRVFESDDKRVETNLGSIIGNASLADDAFQVSVIGGIYQFYYSREKWRRA